MARRTQKGEFTGKEGKGRCVRLGYMMGVRTGRDGILGGRAFARLTKIDAKQDNLHRSPHGLWAYCTYVRASAGLVLYGAMHDTHIV